MARVSGGVAAVLAAGGGHAGMPGEFHGSDGEVPECGHGLGAVAGPDLGGVFAVLASDQELGLLALGVQGIGDGHQPG
jgi:hypothetical protein